MELPNDLRNFIIKEKWTYAKTMPKWPHEYIVRKNTDEKSFVLMVEFIRKYGYVGKFYDKEIIYFDYDNLTYWTMGAPVNETTIINRAQKENTYEIRVKNGTLPE